MRAVRMVMVAAGLMLVPPAPTAYAAVGIPEAEFIFGWNNYLKRHCPPWHIDRDRALAFFRDVDFKANALRITQGAALMVVQMEKEGDVPGHCAEVFGQLGPDGLNLLTTR